MKEVVCFCFCFVLTKKSESWGKARESSEEKRGIKCKNWCKTGGVARETKKERGEKKRKKGWKIKKVEEGIMDGGRSKEENGTIGEKISWRSNC